MKLDGHILVCLCLCETSTISCVLCWKFYCGSIGCRVQTQKIVWICLFNSEQDSILNIVKLAISNWTWVRRFCCCCCFWIEQIFKFQLVHLNSYTNANPGRIYLKPIATPKLTPANPVCNNIKQATIIVSDHWMCLFVCLSVRLVGCSVLVFNLSLKFANEICIMVQNKQLFIEHSIGNAKLFIMKCNRCKCYMIRIGRLALKYELNFMFNNAY